MNHSTKPWLFLFGLSLAACTAPAGTPEPALEFDADAGVDEDKADTFRAERSCPAGSRLVRTYPGSIFVLCERTGGSSGGGSSGGGSSGGGSSGGGSSGGSSANGYPTYCPRPGQAAIVYTMDDAAPGQAEALRIFSGRAPFTVFPFEHQNAAPIVQAAKQYGHELGMHGALQAPTRADLDANFDYMSRIGARTPLVMALPFGNTAYVDLVAARGVIGARGTRCVPAVTGAFDRFNTPGCSLKNDTTTAQVRQWLQNAKVQGGIVITYAHGFPALARNASPAQAPIYSAVETLVAEDARDGSVMTLSFRQALSCARQ